MNFGRMLSLAIAIVAVLAVFVFIPVVSEYAFWVLVLAYLVMELSDRHNLKNRFKFWLMIAIALLLLAIVALFVEIPVVSDYAFWVLFAAYLIPAGARCG
jgi:anti-sigma-K factor RskA